MTGIMKVAFIGALCFVLGASLSEAKALVAQQKFNKGSLLFDENSLSASNTLYGLCDDSKDQAEKKCDIVLKENRAEGKGADLTCNVVLKAQSKNGVVSKVRVVYAQAETVFVLWSEKEKSSMESTLMATVFKINDCKSAKTFSIGANNRPLEEVVVVPQNVQEGPFHVIYNNPQVCEGKLCKLTVDATGKVVSERAGWVAVTPNADVKVFPVLQKGVTKKYLVVESTLEAAKLSLVGDDGAHVLNSYPVKGVYNIAVSTSHQTVGVCFESNSKFDCYQYDFEGSQKSKNTMHVHHKVANVVMENVHEGGYLLLVTVCTSADTCHDTSSHVYKFAADGKHVKDVAVEEFKCNLVNDKVVAKFYKDNLNNEQCVSQVCYQDQVESEQKADVGHYGLVSKCYADL